MAVQAVQQVQVSAVGAQYVTVYVVVLRFNEHQRESLLSVESKVNKRPFSGAQAPLFSVKL